jgi:hypothetical protein
MKRNNPTGQREQFAKNKKRGAKAFDCFYVFNSRQAMFALGPSRLRVTVPLLSSRMHCLFTADLTQHRPL